ncbi:MAG: 50S ribosomal protein L10 [Erysipelotrichaceae bacterium]
MNDKVLKAKEELVSEIETKLKGAESAIIVEYHGLSVTETIDLRRKLRAEDVELKVYKNSLATRATENAGFKELLEHLKGPNAIAFSSDAVAPSRILVDFAKKHEALKIKAGLVEGSYVDQSRINEISKLPNRDGMISMLLGCFQAPVRNFAYAIKAIADSKDAE